MPMAIPLAMAAGSIFAGVSAGGLIGGAMIAGGAMSAIGAVTKNKKLTKIGGLVSLVGGVAGLASGAWASAASGLAEQTALTGMEVGGELGGIGGGMAAAEPAATGIAAQAAPMVAAPQAPTGIAAQNLATPTASIQPPIAASADVVDIGSAALQQPAGPNVAQEAFRSSELNAALKGGGDVSAWKSGAGDVANWMKNNKELVNTGSGIVSGAMKQASEEDLLREKWKAEDAAIARRRAEMSKSVVGLKGPVFQPPKG